MCIRFVEKNPTVVNFPVKNLELKDCEYCHVSEIGVSCCRADSFTDEENELPTVDEAKDLKVSHALILHRNRSDW